MTQPADRCVSVDYHDPDGATATCTNSERSDARITIGDRSWTLEGTAHAGGWISVLSGLRDVSVKAGDAVADGAALGLAGRNLDGACVVALELWRGRAAVDPAPLVERSSRRR